MSGSLISAPVVSLLTLCLLYSVWASPIGHESLPVDVVILMDASVFIKEGNFAKSKEFVKSFALDFDVGPNGLNMGVISFAHRTHVEFSLNNYTTSDSLLAAIDSIQYMGKARANMEEPLRLVRQEAFTKTNGDRDDAPNILIVIADGRVVDQDGVKKEAAELKKTNINTFVVTVKLTEEMRAIASKDENIFQAPDFNDLENVHFNLTTAVHEVTLLLSGIQGTFTITTHVSDVRYSGTIDWYYIIIQFESRKTWRKSFRISPNTGFYSNTNYTYDQDATYYGVHDKIHQVLVFKNFGSDAFFPEYFIINGPRECDRYECNWKKECMKEHAASDNMYKYCFLGNEDAVAVPCELANADDNCAALYN